MIAQETLRNVQRAVGAPRKMPARGRTGRLRAFGLAFTAALLGCPAPAPTQGQEDAAAPSGSSSFASGSSSAAGNSGVSIASSVGVSGTGSGSSSSQGASSRSSSRPPSSSAASSSSDPCAIPANALDAGVPTLETVSAVIGLGDGTVRAEGAELFVRRNFQCDTAVAIHRLALEPSGLAPVSPVFLVQTFPTAGLLRLGLAYAQDGGTPALFGGSTANALHYIGGEHLDGGTIQADLPGSGVYVVGNVDVPRPANPDCVHVLPAGSKGAWTYVLSSVAFSTTDCSGVPLPGLDAGRFGLSEGSSLGGRYDASIRNMPMEWNESGSQPGLVLILLDIGADALAQAPMWLPHLQSTVETLVAAGLHVGLSTYRPGVREVTRVLAYTRDAALAVQALQDAVAGGADAGSIIPASNSLGGALALAASDLTDVEPTFQSAENFGSGSTVSKYLLMLNVGFPNSYSWFWQNDPTVRALVLAAGNVSRFDLGSLQASARNTGNFVFQGVGERDQQAAVTLIQGLHRATYSFAYCSTEKAHGVRISGAGVALEGRTGGMLATLADVSCTADFLRHRCDMLECGHALCGSCPNITQYCDENSNSCREGCAALGQCMGAVASPANAPPMVCADPGCDNMCVDTALSSQHCGGCGNSCQVACSAGSCARAVDVAVGPRHACAALEDGYVRCWGINRYGQLGAVSADTVKPLQVVGVTNSRGVVSAPLADVTCALGLDDGVRCWGEMLGGFGDGMSLRQYTPVRNHVALAEVDTLTLGQSHACATRRDRSLWCWGDNRGGRVGNGQTPPNNHVVQAVRLPVQVALTDVVAVASGSVHSCAIHGPMRGVSCWGVNADQQLGAASPAMTGVPVPVPGLTDAVRLHGAGLCAEQTDGTVVCWGRGLNDHVTSGPVRIQGPQPFSRMVFASPGNMCVLQLDGQVTCWSRGDIFDAGLPTAVRVLSPVAAPALANVVALSAQSANLCAVTQDGQVWCWGSGEPLVRQGAPPGDTVGQILFP